MTALGKKKKASLFEVYDEIEKGGNPVTYADCLVTFVGVCFVVALVVNYWM